MRTIGLSTWPRKSRVEDNIRSKPHYGFSTLSIGPYESVFALNGNLSSLQVNSDDVQINSKNESGLIASIHRICSAVTIKKSSK